MGLLDPCWGHRLWVAPSALITVFADLRPCWGRQFSAHGRAGAERPEVMKDALTGRDLFPTVSTA